MLKIDGLSRSFGERWAVQELSATLAPGEVVGFLGPNGAGKTTTIKMISGLLVPSKGSVSIFGHDVHKSPGFAKANVAYIPDRPYTPERLSALELLEYVAGIYGHPRELALTRGMEELERFGLKGRENDLLASYSHGMRQRALLASALMRDPKLVLVDEPMVGLDPQGARLVKTILRESAKRGAVVLMSTHTLSVVEEICERVLVMRQGELVADGSVEDLVARLPEDSGGNRLEDLFMVLTQ